MTHSSKTPSVCRILAAGVLLASAAIPAIAQEPSPDTAPVTIPPGAVITNAWIEEGTGLPGYVATLKEKRHVRLGGKEYDVERERQPDVKPGSHRAFYDRSILDLPGTSLYLLEGPGKLRDALALPPTKADDVTHFWFGPDGRIVAYLAVKGLVYTAVIGKKELACKGEAKLYPFAEGSDDGRSFRLTDDSGTRVVVNGTTTQIPKFAQNLTLSEGGRKVAYELEIRENLEGLFVNGSKVVEKRILRRWGFDPGGGLYYSFSDADERGDMFWGDAKLSWKGKECCPPGTELSGKGIWFSPDGKRIAFTLDQFKRLAAGVKRADDPRAKEAEKNRYQLFIDSKPVHTFAHDGAIANFVPSTDVCFSKDGRKVAWTAKDGASTFVHIEGRKSEAYSGIDWMLYSDDGQLVFAAAKGAGKVLVIDFVEKETFDSLTGAPLFSPDGKKFALIAKRAGKSIVFDGGVAGPPFAEVATPRYSTKGEIYYLAAVGADRVVMAGDKEIARAKYAQGEVDRGPAFAFILWTDGTTREFIVVTERGVRTFGSEPLFLPGGNDLTYWAKQSGKDSSKLMLVSGEFEQELPFDHVYSCSKQGDEITVVGSAGTTLSVQKIKVK
ncbi:MAG: hypothetical protein K8T20_13385 [Planctomycetes bacterium]|nr:hypothetical protein [Planctomycetota bacterium]